MHIKIFKEQMMKNLFKLFTLTFFSPCLSACSKYQIADYAKAQKNQKGEIIIEEVNQPTEDSLKQKTTAEPSKAPEETQKATAQDVKLKPSAQSDMLDLTKMSATMIYAEVFNMLIAPEAYLGKDIKISGYFQVYTNPAETERYYAIIIPDATACCQQGLEFVWEGEHSYPEDYPEIGAKITVIGKYEIEQMDDGIEYCFLRLYSLTTE